MKPLKYLSCLAVIGALLAPVSHAEDAQADKKRAADDDAYSAEAFNEELLRLQRESDILEMRLLISSLLKEIKEAEAEASDDAAPDSVPGHVQAELDALRSRNSEERRLAEMGGRIEDLYVTRIEGFGRNLVATIYNQNHVMQAHRGEEVVPGVIVQEITRSGVTFSRDGKSVRVPLTTVDIAHRNTIRRNELRSQGLSPEEFMSQSMMGDNAMGYPGF